MFCCGLITSFFIFEETPFILLLLLLTFVVPVFMIIISFVAGLGKAFEAGFSSATILNELNSIWNGSKNQLAEREKVTERYSSPDGMLTLIVVRQEGDITIGFDGLPWHTHPDNIANLRGENDKEQALRKYLEDLFNDRLPIVLMMKGDVVSEPYILNFPDEAVDSKDFEPDESYKLRFWGGSTKKAELGISDCSGASSIASNL